MVGDNRRPIVGANRDLVAGGSDMRQPILFAYWSKLTWESQRLPDENPIMCQLIVSF